jgi:divalent metal cation (Fe/Co/Zn/Cd) transporter
MSTQAHTPKRQSKKLAQSGSFVNWLASVVNGFWCWMLISRGRKLRSPALVADGKHLLADVVTSGGVATIDLDKDNKITIKVEPHGEASSAPKKPSKKAEKIKS